MRWHVIRALHIMKEARKIFGRKPVEKQFEILPHRRIRAFIDA